MACPFFLSYRKKNYTYRLHFDYKSRISFTKRAFRLQKLRFGYKYILVILQTYISVYKDAPRFTIDQVPCKESGILLTSAEYIEIDNLRIFIFRIFHPFFAYPLIIYFSAFFILQFVYVKTVHIGISRIKHTSTTDSCRVINHMA